MVVAVGLERSRRECFRAVACAYRATGAMRPRSFLTRAPCSRGAPEAQARYAEEQRQTGGSPTAESRARRAEREQLRAGAKPVARGL